MINLPTNSLELCEIVAEAAGRNETLELLGGASKRACGRPMCATRSVELSRFAGVVEYEPAELVLTAQAATPLDEIETLLAKNGQMLAFEPPDWRALLGTGDRRQTIGGVLACNLAGPRRPTAGAARDHFLGMAGVNGRGELFKSGGKVVKNVTGYDLCKLLAGSFGTLAAMTEISVKVLPRPEIAVSLVLTGLDDAVAIRAMSLALNSPHEVSGAAHLPRAVADASGLACGRAVTVLRLEGPAPSVVHRAESLAAELASFASAECLDGDVSVRLWREISDAGLLVEPRNAPVWRISVPPMSGADIAAGVGHHLPCRIFYDWGGGLVWLAIADAPTDGGAACIRAALAQAGAGGHATLLRADAALRGRIAVFEPLAPPLVALTARVKQAFDPRGVFNPGRMYPGI